MLPACLVVDELRSAVASGHRPATHFIQPSCKLSDIELTSHTCLCRKRFVQVCFVDLKPVPPTAKPVTPEGFAVLLSMLTGADKLDGWELAQAVDAADLQTKVWWNCSKCVTRAVD